MSYLSVNTVTHHNTMAIAPETQTTSELTKAGIQHELEREAPLQPNGANGHTNGHVNGNSNGVAKTSSTESDVAPLDASRLVVSLTTSPRPVPVPNGPEVRTYKVCTDHMVTCQWTAEEGWAAPAIVPYGPLSIMPSASVLHYATECFEGMKLYRGFDGKLRLFRPDLNARRMLISSTRIALPGFDPEELMKLIVSLCARDGPKWLPKDRAGQFLYIRPTMIGNDPALGVQRPREALLYVILACFPTMDAGRTDPVTGAPRGMRLLASQEDMVRAWPGGFGYAKVGANYGPSLVAQGEARSRGYDQVLWLLGDDFRVTEAGASNFFVVWRSKEGNKLQLVTAPLGGKLILDGITRRSVLELARTRLAKGWAEGGLEPLEVVERTFNMAEVEEAILEGRMVEAFGAGTAFFIAPVECINFKGRDLPISCELRGDECSGKYTALIKGWLKGIMYGKERHDWGFVVEETA